MALKYLCANLEGLNLAVDEICLELLKALDDSQGVLKQLDSVS